MYSAVKYHYFHRRFTYRVKRGRHAAQPQGRDEVRGGLLPVHCHRFERASNPLRWFATLSYPLWTALELLGQSSDREFGWGGAPAK